MGRACWCRCRVLLLLEWCARSKALQGAAARCCRCCSQSGVWNGHAGAAAGRVPAVWGCRCRVLLSNRCLHLRSLGAATGSCCQSAVRALGVAARYLWQWAMALMEMTAGPRASRCTDAQMWSRLAWIFSWECYLRSCEYVHMCRCQDKKMGRCQGFVCKRQRRHTI